MTAATVVLITIAVLALIVADTLAREVVQERWIALRKRHHKPAFARDRGTPVSDWVLSDQRYWSRQPMGALWCYYFRKECYR